MESGICPKEVVVGHYETKEQTEVQWKASPARRPAIFTVARNPSRYEKRCERVNESDRYPTTQALLILTAFFSSTERTDSSLVKGGKYKEIRYAGKPWTVGHIIKLLRPAARFGTIDIDVDLFPLTCGEPPVLPTEPTKNTDLIKVFCGIAKDLIPHKSWISKSTIRPGTSVYLHASLRGIIDKPTY